MALIHSLECTRMDDAVCAGTYGDWCSASTVTGTHDGTRHPPMEPTGGHVREYLFSIYHTDQKNNPVETVCNKRSLHIYRHSMNYAWRS